MSCYGTKLVSHSVPLNRVIPIQRIVCTQNRNNTFYLFETQMRLLIRIVDTRIVVFLIPHPVASEHRWLVKPLGGFTVCRMSRTGGRGVAVAMRDCGICTRRHKHVPFVNISSPRSRSIQRRKGKHELGYYDVVFVHLATRCGFNTKDPSGLDSDRWIPHSRCCENPARFSHHPPLTEIHLSESSPSETFATISYHLMWIFVPIYQFIIHW